MLTKEKLLLKDRRLVSQNIKGDIPYERYAT